MLPKWNVHDALVTVSVSLASPPSVIVTVTSPSAVRLWSVKSPLQTGAHRRHPERLGERDDDPVSLLGLAGGAAAVEQLQRRRVGAVFCTSTMTAAEVKVLPDLSVVTTLQVVLAVAERAWCSRSRRTATSCRRLRGSSTCPRRAVRSGTARSDSGAGIGRARRDGDARAVDEGVRGGCGDRSRGRGVVDADVGDRRRREGVADVVGGDDPQVVEPVGVDRGVPASPRTERRCRQRRGSTTFPRPPARSGTARSRRPSRRRPSST